MKTDLSIIVPAHNEEENLAKLMAEIRNTLGDDGYEVIIVNDNSTDGTKKVLEELAGKYPQLKPIHRTPPQGVGHTLRTGFAAASGDIIVTMDADLSHDPNDIPRLIEKLNEGYDIVLGSRYMEGGEIENTLSRKIISKSFSVFTKILGLHVKDATTGFRAHKRLVLEALKLSSVGFEIHIEIPMKAGKKGYWVAEVPIIYHERYAGESKLNYAKEGPRYVKAAVKCALGL
ncbi:MAG: polyprenol monophosphomannose synthase [Candidatus Altiarchaeota archaeon]